MATRNSSSLDSFFAPRGVVVVGVSHDPTKLGYAMAQNMQRSGFPGAIHFVNPKRGVLLGQPVYPDVTAVPDPADLAMLLLPAAGVPDVLEQCGARGIRAAIIASGGFREAGPEGAALEAECLRIAGGYGMRLIGPNCIGLIDTHLPLNTTFPLPPGPLPGDIGLLSHSGAICAALIDWARAEGLGFSQLVSLGNQADVTEVDVLAPVAQNDYTKVVALYMEGVSNGRRFVQQAIAVARHKPIVALKVGRSAAGQRAAASHTGALAGQESAFDAAFRRAGVLRATTIEEMFNWARALAWCPLPAGAQVAVLTNAGGPGVMAADTLAARGIPLATLGAETTELLREILPAAASLANPVDLLATATPRQYADCLRLLLADAAVHAVLVIIPPPPMDTAAGVARALIPLIQVSDKPVVIALMGGALIQEAIAYFRAARVPVYRFPEDAAAALAVLAERAAFFKRPPESGLLRAAVDKARARNLLAGQAPGFLPQEVVNGLLAAYGLRTPPVALAADAATAVTHADQMGYPVALKIASPDLPHKSDVGGVLLNVADAEEVRAGFATLLGRARAAAPQAQLLGTHVQPMIAPGQEVIVGVVQDAQFGPVVMFGAGGVEVEGLQDVAFALAPVTASDLKHLLEATWAGRRLGGFRQMAAVDATAVREAIIRLGQLAVDFPELAEIEINPLRALPQGAYALDARARLCENGAV